VTLPTTTTSWLAVRPAPESRPPADVRAQPLVADPLDSVTQPALPFERPPLILPQPADEPDPVVPLLEAAPWSAALAVALFEAVQGRRPVGQLTRWVDERVQAAISYHRRRSGAPAPGLPAVLRSVRVQHPRADVAEVCAHLGFAGRSSALAFRLEIWGGRWLCTALCFS
jgi:Family of unknown function (DUF6459)